MALAASELAAVIYRFRSARAPPSSTSAEHDAHTAELLVRQDRSALQRCEKLGARELDHLGMSRRDHPVVIRELAIHDLAHELDVGETEPDLVAENLHGHGILDLAEQ